MSLGGFSGPYFRPAKKPACNMYKNYLKVAIRHLWKSKSVSAINIIGLATGLVVCILIVLFVLKRQNLRYRGGFANLCVDLAGQFSNQFVADLRRLANLAI